ncbi:HD domain-containing protein [Pontivivens ytuae]|uniref:5'-deoxynucleotidase n=1 Tax=Pontivivens ytuae TaxID=2789856 RepID=A0A7S9QC74_9RHOB|nr:HD domain-containing protein [Pontivivens ytuae]QPH52806.1 HD domain-containing protein [Pontivivens ytuae]
METERLKAIVDFLQAAEALKDTLRSGHTGAGRRESTAEHTWRLCLLALLLEGETEVDALRLLQLCIVHDLGEAISGDIPATEQQAEDGRKERERADMARLCAPLPPDLRDRMIGLWKEYEAGETAEAVMAKGLDKIETMLQHLAGRNPEDFDYGFNLGYGVGRTQRHPLLRTLRAEVDARTRRRMTE